MAFCVPATLHIGIWYTDEGHTGGHGLERTALVLLTDPHTCLSLANTHPWWKLPLSPVHHQSWQHLSCTLVDLWLTGAAGCGGGAGHLKVGLGTACQLAGCPPSES